MGSVHIGKQIKGRLEAVGMSKSEFARRINTTPQNVFGIFKRQSIDTNMLERISEVLEYDFFTFYHSDNPKQTMREPGVMYKSANKLTVCEEKLKQALKEIEYLKKINDLLEAKLAKGK